MSEKPSNPSEAVTSAWTSIMRARERLLGAIEADLKTAGMPPLAWYDVLWELARSQDGKLRPYEIEERTLLASIISLACSTGWKERAWSGARSSPRMDAAAGW